MVSEHKNLTPFDFFNFNIFQDFLKTILKEIPLISMTCRI